MADYTIDDAVGDVIDDHVQATATQIRNGAMNASNVNPDQEAGFKTLADYTGTPIDSVRAMPDVVKQKAAAMQVDAKGIAQNSPATAKMLTSDTSNMAFDDIQNLQDLENHVSKSGALMGLFNNTMLNTYQMVQGARRAWGDYTLNDQMSKDASDKLKFLPEAFKENVPEYDGAGKYIYGAAKGVADTLPLLTTALAAPIAGPAIAFGVTGAASGYGSLTDQGVTPGKAAAGALALGTINAGASFLPLDHITKNLGQQGAVKFLANMLVKDIGSMEAQTIASSAVNQAIANPDGSWEDWAKSLPPELLQAGVTGATFAGMFGAVNAAAVHIGRANPAQSANDTADAIQRTMDVAAASKLRARNPTEFKNFMDNATQDGVQDLFVNPNDLSQSGIDPLEVAKVIPAFGEQLSSSLTTGADIKIPVSDVMTHLAGTELGQAMVDHLKTDPNAFSRAQAKTYKETEGDTLQAQVEKTLEQKQNDDAFMASHTAVKDNILGQLRETNRFTDDANNPNAELTAGIYSSLAAKLGITPEEAFTQFPIKIEADGTLSKTSLNDLNQEVNDKTQSPEFTNWFGNSKVVDENGKPLVLYHGTTHDIEAFDPSIANPESDQGKGIYFSNTSEDIANNYAGEGPDLTSRIEQRAERLADDLQDEYEQHVEEVGEKKAIKAMKDKYGKDNYNEDTLVMARNVARKELSSGKPNTIPAYVKLENPVVIGGKNETKFDFREEYDEETDSYDEPSGTLVQLMDAFREVESDGEFNNFDAEKVIESMLAEHFDGDEIGASDLISNIKHSEGIMYAEDGDGRLVSNEIVRQAFERAGFDGIVDHTVNSKWGSESNRFNKMKGMDENTTHYIVFNPENVKSIFNGGEFDPNNPNILAQDDNANRRGAFDVEKNILSLFKTADLSTYLHELGHFYLETLNKIANTENAPQELKDDMMHALKFGGIETLEDWNGRTLDEKREAHEKFARGFEAYLFTGKAPSLEMQGIFNRFRGWLMNIYRSMTALDVELSPEIRGVFDRMVATSDQIKNAEMARNYEPFFKTAQDAGMNPDEWRAYQELGIAATQDALTNLEGRGLRDMKWLSNAKSREIKELQAKAKTKRNSIRRNVTEEVLNEPQNKARTFFRTGVVDGTKVEGVHRLDVDAVRELYGDGPDAVWRQFESKFGKYGVLGKEGLHPDVAAEMFGFSSGDEMMQEMLKGENPKTKIEAVTDQRMIEKYGDITSPQALARAADEAIHNEVRTKFVATEMNALQKAIGGKKILAEAAKEYAGRMIDRLKIRDLKPSIYSAAENKAAANAEKLRRQGDIRGAAAEKRNQLINMYATKSVYDAQEAIEKGVRYLNKFDRNATRKAIERDHLDQIDALLDRFDFRKRSLKDIANSKSLADWVEMQKSFGLEPEIPAAMMNEANRQNYKDMTVSDLKGLIDTVKQIDHMGRLQNKLLTAHDKATFKATVGKLVTSINDVADAKGLKVVDNRTRANGADRALRIFKHFMAEHRKVASLARELDGFKDGGPMWETFVRGMNDAGNKEADMRAKATKELTEIIDPILKDGRMGGKGIYFESVGRSLNREERIGIALNMGNEGNIQRLLGGEGWTIEQVKPITDTLSKGDWDAVQKIWDHFESYRPDIGAKEKRLYGKEPTWVEPQTVTTQHGEYKGGYYPIKYDPRQSIFAEQHDAADAAKAALQGAYTSATTRRTFTKSRVDEVTGRPLLYSMDGLYSGVNEVIHDLSWHEWVIDAQRLLRNKELDTAIRTRYGAEVNAQFKSATSDIATDDKANKDAVDKVMGHLRSGASIAGLGFNVMSATVNIANITQSAVRIGPQHFMRGLGEWIRSPVQLTNKIYDKSDFMRLRFQTQQREINEIRNKVSGRSELRQTIDQWMFAPMEYSQLAVDAPTWWAAYQKALTEGNEEKRAVALADQGVIDAQGGGQVKDLAAIQRGGAVKKLLTTFYGFFSTSYNLGVEVTKKTNFRDPKDVLRLGGDYLLLYSIPSLIGTAIHSALASPDDFKKPKKLAKKMANDQVNYITNLLVGVRELGGAIQTVAGTSDYNTGYGGPAGLRFFQEMYKLAGQVNSGHMSAAMRRSAINVAGIALHLPSTQINRTIDGITALIDGKTRNPLAIFTGAPKN